MTETSNSPLEKARFNLSEALKLNPKEKYSKQAEDLLTEAIKLDPSLADAWLAIGYIHFHKGDTIQASISFQEAVKLCDQEKEGDKKSALTALSIAIRSTPIAKNTPTMPAFTESIAFAKKAIQCDIEDGKSWYTLGMAYLARFFNRRSVPKDLQDGLSAFQLAEKKLTSPMADLHINRGTIFRFLASFHNARTDYELAIKLDPSLTKAGTFLNEMKATWDLIRNAIEKKLKIKTSRLQSPDIDPCSTLKQGKNEEKTLGAVFIQCVTLSTETPQLFICADKEGTRFVLAIYDVTSDIFRDGSVIQIKRPTLGPITWDGKTVYSLVTVEDHSTLTIDGAEIPQSAKVMPEMSK